MYRSVSARPEGINRAVHGRPPMKRRKSFNSSLGVGSSSLSLSLARAVVVRPFNSCIRSGEETKPWVIWYRKYRRPSFSSNRFVSRGTGAPGSIKWATQFAIRRSMSSPICPPMASRLVNYLTQNFHFGILSGQHYTPESPPLLSFLPIHDLNANNRIVPF